MDAVMELAVEPGPEAGSYVVRVLRSAGGGEPVETVTVDLERLITARGELEWRVLASSVPARRLLPEAEAALQEVGAVLFDSLFSGAIGTAYRASLAVAAERGGGIRLALRLAAPGLAALPWEALFDRQTQSYLCLREPLVRRVAAPYAPAALAIAPPLRILGMVASPSDLAALDVGGERERLEGALRTHIEAGRVELHWLDDVTWAAVHDRLLDGEWHVLHFIGHGAFDLAADEGVLAFVGRDGRTEYVSADRLAGLLHEAEPTPRLVVLNSCQSGAVGTVDLLSGTAAALAHSGIHAVAAMQFAISDQAAIEFARGFYAALARGRPIDEAVRSGRIGVLGMNRNTLEWVTPVLYVRGEDTRVFEVAPSPGEPERVAPPVAVEPATAADRVRSRSPWPVALIAVAAIIIAGLGVLVWLRPDLVGGNGGNAVDGRQATTRKIAVPMALRWTPTGITCAEGDTVAITVTGEAWFTSSDDSKVGPEGLPGNEFAEYRSYPDASTASVIGVLNEVGGTFPVGRGITYTCPAAGALLLGPNDYELAGNHGEFQATIVHTPAE